MTKGILWVSSRITQPNNLSAQKFCKWYEDIHIQQVLALPGIPCAARWEAIVPQPDNETWSSKAPWLTVYEMPDISYRNSAAFKALDGQAAPQKELLDGIFRKARFDTRFFAEVQVYENPHPLPPPSPTAKKFLLSAALQPPDEQVDDFDGWYRKEHLGVLASAPGYVRTRRYEVVSGTALDEFERSERDGPRFLALHEFVCEELPWKELRESAETEWAKRVMGGLEEAEVGWYVSKRVYEEKEWGRVGKE